MKMYSWCAALILVTVATITCVFGGDGKAFPTLSDDWVRIQFKKSPVENAWRCRVYRNLKTGDLLSFGLRSVSPKEPDDLNKWADTAQEVFPIGNPSWASPNSLSASSDLVKADVGTFALDGIHGSKGVPMQALEYVQVVAVPGGDNRMVRGYLFLLNGLVLIVQHTSFKPITDDLVRTVAEPLVRESRDLAEVFDDKQTGTHNIDGSK